MLELNNESGVAPALHPAAVLLFPLCRRSFIRQTSSACSLSPSLKLAAGTALPSRQVEEGPALLWDAESLTLNCKLQVDRRRRTETERILWLKSHRFFFCCCCFFPVCAKTNGKQTCSDLSAASKGQRASASHDDAPSCQIHGAQSHPTAGEQHPPVTRVCLLPPPPRPFVCLNWHTCIH